MKVLADLLKIAALGVLAIVVWSWATGQQHGGGSPELLSGFERLEVWDISPEEGFERTLVKEHVTEGAHALKVVFPVSAWPSINTKKLRHSGQAFEALSVDVFNPQEQALKFAVRLDDASGRKVTVDRRLKSGANQVRISWSDLKERIDPSRIAFVVFFLKRPNERVTLYFDNLRVVRGPEKTSEKKVSAVHEPRAEKANPSKRSSDDAPKAEWPLPEPAVLPQAPTEGEIQVAVVKLRSAEDGQSLVSSGIPFAPGQLHSAGAVTVSLLGQELPLAKRVLARWPKDRSIRSLLVQFRLQLSEGGNVVTLRWGREGQESEVPVTEVAWELPEALLALPASWLCDSQVIGEQVPMYAHAMPGYDQRIDAFYAQRRDDRLTGDIREDGYYSTPHVFYQLYVRSGDLDKFRAARRELIAYREKEIIHEGRNKGRHVRYPEPRYLYVEALVDDYLLTGDERSKEVAAEMAAHLGAMASPEKAFYPKESNRFWTERYYAAILLGLTGYAEISGDPKDLELAGQYVEQLYRTQQQWPQRGGYIHNLYAHDPEEGARPDEYGGSPFMTGLLLEGMIKYHRLTGSEIAARSILRAVDWLMNEGLAFDRQTFRYLTADKYRDESGPPDLNLLIVHAFGYAYRLSGYKHADYLELGIRILQKGIKDAYLKDRKHFNQNFRSSGHFLAYIAGADSGSGLWPQTSMFHSADFEHSLSQWSGSPQAELDRMVDEERTGSRVLQVRGQEPLTLRRDFESWDLKGFPVLSFAYKLPPGLPLWLRARTRYGDWIDLADTAASAQEREPAPQRLIDDSQWHELKVNVADAVKSVLPGVSTLAALEYTADAHPSLERGFWIDDIAITH